MEREHEELLQIQLQLCTHAMPVTLSIDALKSLALLRYQMHTPVGAAHLASNYTRSISSKNSKYGAIMIPIFHGHGIHVCESCFARDISKVFGAHPWPFLKCNQSGFPSIQSSTSPPHQSLGLWSMIMQYAISTSIFDTGAISSPKHLQRLSVILPLHHYNAAKIPKGACNTAGSPSRSCLRKSPQLSRGLEPYKWNSSKCSLYGIAMYKW